MNTKDLLIKIEEGIKRSEIILAYADLLKTGRVTKKEHLSLTKNTKK
jgi:hypothetical protein|tara:strand:+ start:671 stop:811 length:141 start_codon:yes stop_codon:yes gene_type:complete